jgi:phage terminase large subunit
MTVVSVQLPPKLVPVFSSPRGSLRYRGAFGGRGSGKSFSFAKMAAIFGYAEPLRILCVRELQSSIKESFHAEIKNAIASTPWLADAYDVGVDYVRGKNGTEFIFKGLRHNQGSIKSLAQIDICIVEEAEDVPETSWQSLEPTIRAPKSEIWIIWNPRYKDSPVDSRFIQSVPPRSSIVKMNYNDNPWFPDVLEEQRTHAKETMDDALYRHVWEGDYYELSESQIFRNKYRVEEFEPHHKLWDGPYCGLDFGFAKDPTAAVKCWVFDKRLWVEYDAGMIGLELDDTAEYLNKRIPDFGKYKIRADSARPESISYLKRHGLPFCVGVEKGKGSVEDGIEHIKSYNEVIIHPRCKNTLSEFRLYSYKTDRLTGEVQPVPVDDNNHYIDALRYALRPLMSKGARGYTL